jgi:hypothetical protein
LSQANGWSVCPMEIRFGLVQQGTRGVLEPIAIGSVAIRRASAKSVLQNLIHSMRMRKSRPLRWRCRVCSRMDLDRALEHEGARVPLQAAPNALPEHDAVLGIAERGPRLGWLHPKEHSRGRLASEMSEPGRKHRGNVATWAGRWLSPTGHGHVPRNAACFGRRRTPISWRAVRISQPSLPLTKASGAGSGGSGVDGSGDGRRLSWVRGGGMDVQRAARVVRSAKVTCRNFETPSNGLSLSQSDPSLPEQTMVSAWAHDPARENGGKSMAVFPASTRMRLTTATIPAMRER